MPREQKDADAALQKLGQRIRAGHAKQHPISQRSLETVDNTVREVWEQEQKAKSAQKPSTTPAKGKTRKPQEPDIEP